MAGCLLTWMQSLLLLEDVVLLRLLNYDAFHLSRSIAIPLSIIQFLCLWLGRTKFNLTLKIDFFVCFNFTNTILKMAIINLSFQFIFFHLQEKYKVMSTWNAISNNGVLWKLLSRSLSSISVYVIWQCICCLAFNLCHFLIS